MSRKKISILGAKSDYIFCDARCILDEVIRNAKIIIFLRLKKECSCAYKPADSRAYRLPLRDPHWFSATIKALMLQKAPSAVCMIRPGEYLSPRQTSGRTCAELRLKSTRTPGSQSKDPTYAAPTLESILPASAQDQSLPYGELP
jgi:hypothetical protein